MHLKKFSNGLHVERLQLGDSAVEKVALNTNDLDGNAVDGTHALVNALDKLLGFGDLLADVHLDLLGGFRILEHLKVFLADKKAGIGLLVLGDDVFTVLQFDDDLRGHILNPILAEVAARLGVELGHRRSQFLDPIDGQPHGPRNIFVLVPSQQVEVIGHNLVFLRLLLPGPFEL